MKIHFLTLTLLVFLTSCTNKKTSITPSKNNYITKVNLCVQNNKISTDWINALAGRHSNRFIDSLSNVKRELTNEEKEWHLLVQRNAPKWNRIKDSLKVPFDKININDTTNVYLGYLGYDDAFIYKDKTICFNLTALVRQYGSAQKPKNQVRINRFFAHEYTHLLSREWAKKMNKN